MEKSSKFLLPGPNFDKTKTQPIKSNLHFLTPSGMSLLPRDKQPPPMYGAKGSTVPSKFLNQSNRTPSEKPPERHFCETCEMDLQSKEDFRRHRAQHEGCPVDGCKFKGHYSVMDKHVTEVHTSGVFEKIKKLSTPEEIAAWREERRKKYPTLANAKMRQLALEQRQKRGERLEENKSRFGRREDRKRARTVKCDNEKNQKIPRKMNDRNQKRNDRQPKAVQKNEANKNTQLVKIDAPSKVDREKISCGIYMFEGTSKLKDYKHEKSKKQKENALTGLIGMYGSDDESNDESECESSMDEISTSANDDIKTIKESIISEIGESNAIPSYNEDIITKSIESPLSSTKIIKTFNEEPDEIVEPSCSKQYEVKHDHVEAQSNELSLSSTKSIKTSNEEPVGIVEPSCSKQEEIKDEHDCAEDSSDEGPLEAPIQHTCSTVTVETIKTSNINKELDEMDADKPFVKRQKLDNATTKSQQQTRKYGLDYRRVRLRKQNTMLEKLLEPDIRHERNVLLQCVRFVCENDFFGIGSKKENK